MSLMDSGGETVLCLEDADSATAPHPLRRVLRYPSRLIACQHMEAVGLLSAAVAVGLLTHDLQEIPLCFPVLIQDPKATLRGFMHYPVTPYH